MKTRTEEFISPPANPESDKNPTLCHIIPITNNISNNPTLANETLYGKIHFEL